MGTQLARNGAVIGAIAGIYDAGQNSLAANRSHTAGDKTASTRYATATAFYTAGAISSTFAVFSPVFLGPLGIAISFAISAYAVARLAQQSESTPLERWARRCYFGQANETPAIHWNLPEHQDLAFAELNAATLGIVAVAGFEAERIDPTVIAKVGRIEALDANHRVRFRVVLPGFSKPRSGYHWTLTTHRHGDSPASDLRGSEVISSDKSNELPHSATAMAMVTLSSSKLPRFPDYEKDSIKLHNAIREPSLENWTTGNVEISGSVKLLGNIANHNSKTATLSVTYWPDLSLPVSYAEIFNKYIRIEKT